MGVDGHGGDVSLLLLGAWFALEMPVLGTLVMVGRFRGSSGGHLWQSIITAFLVPGLPCECSWGHRAKSWVTSASQVTLTPGIPRSVSFLGLYDTIPFFPSLPQSLWPALIRQFSLLSLIAQCVGFLRAPLQLLLFF